jgi:hypothetical protein
VQAAKRFEQLLRVASDKVALARDFHCLLVRRELLGDVLGPAEEIDFSQRFNPHALRLEWVGQRFSGRKMVYVAGANDDKVLVHPEGIAGRLKSELRLSLDSPLLKSQGRHTPDMIGYNRLIQRMVGLYEDGRARHLVWVISRLPAQETGRRAECFDVAFEPVLLDTDVSKMVVWFDFASSLPVHTMLYDGSGRLVEDYEWRDIALDLGLTDADFTFGKK